MQTNGGLELDAAVTSGSPAVLRVTGSWTVTSASRLQRLLERLPGFEGRGVVIDAERLDALDTTGALLLDRVVERLRGEGLEVEIRGLGPRQQTILERVAQEEHEAIRSPPSGSAGRQLVERVGEGALGLVDNTLVLIAFFGQVLVAAGRVCAHPRRFRFRSLVFHMELVGFNALPIVGLISFLIGIVLAYQGAVQLRQFGAVIFVVDLIGVAILRELGILLTAIVVAGRSGSSFTAELGSMKLNEEVDALRTMGVDPIEVLVLPRVLALVITLPLLAFYADVMGLVGGGLLSWALLDVSPRVFVERLNVAIGMWTFWLGILKAPVFATVIALVGCLEGLEVRGSSESLGRNTTRSVVHAIFLVIVLDALFSVLFNVLGI